MICLKLLLIFLLDGPFLVFVEPNYIGQWFSTTPNDLDMWGHWYISEIELDKAWDVSIGSSEVKVGVIDSGIDSTHLDLVGQIDTQLSYSFSHNTGTAINPIHDHGTGVASIIGAIGNNGIGTAGINWKTSLVSLRADGIDRNGDGIYDESLQYVTDAINYTANHDIPILNFSG